MTKHFQDVTETELSVLDVLWEQGPATIRQLTETLYPAGGASHYATVQKLLERLEGKSCVARNRSAAIHVFTAVVDRDTLVGRRLQHVADQLCGGSWTPLLTHLVHGKRLSKKERQALRKLIDELDQSSAKG